MRTIFTNEDAKFLCRNLLKAQDEEILVVDEYGIEQGKQSLWDSLNIKFYSWKNRLVAGESPSDAPQSAFDTWVDSIENSMNAAYGLVEITDSEIVPSQDIDSATFTGRITFIVQTNKIKNLEYLCEKARSNYIGVTQDIVNSYGETVKSYVTFGILSYDSEPEMYQFGECIIATLNFRVSYLSDALNYNDVKIELSFDGDDVYYMMPYTKSTWQTIMANQAVPRFARPDLTGFVSTSVVTAKTFTFFDFNKKLEQRINDIFWTLGAVQKDGVATAVQDVNVIVWVKVTTGGHVYKYCDVVDNIEKVITNGEFNVTSLTLKGYGKAV